MTQAKPAPGTEKKMTDDEIIESIGAYEFGWHDSDVAGAAARRGLSEDVVRDISSQKNESEWMLEQRLKALRMFEKKPMPKWGADLRSEEHTSELQSRGHLVCRLLLE